MEYFFTTYALRQMKKLPPEVQRQIINRLEEALSEKTILADSKKLKGERYGQYRFRVSDYRVIFDIDSSLVKILAVGHRKEIYR